MYTTGEIAAQLAWRRPASTPSTSRCSGAAARPSPRPRRSWSTPRSSDAYYLEQNEYVPFDPEAGHYQLAIPGQHELALALPWGGTSHPVWFASDPRVANVKALGGVFNRALMHGVPQIVAGALEATKDMDARREGRRAGRDRRPGDEHDAAAREPAAQQVARLGARLRAARPRALRHPRQPELQADRAAAGLRGVLAAAAAAASGSASPRAARRSGTASCSACCAASGWSWSPVADRRRTERPCGWSTTWTRARRSARRALPDHRRRDLRRTPRCRTLSSASRRRWRAVGVAPGDKVAILSANDPVAFTCVFGISRAGAVWCPINPRNEAAENRELLDLFDCTVLIFQARFAPLVDADPRRPAEADARWSASTATARRGAVAGTSSSARRRAA